MLFLVQQQLAVNRTLKISIYVSLVQNTLSRKKDQWPLQLELRKVCSNLITAAYWTASYNYLIITAGLYLETCLQIYVCISYMALGYFYK